jgi:NADPH:quinone reductase-like Zn-dependent oxidoreductase
MRAILRTAFGGLEVLVIRKIPEPEPKDGHAVIEVKAFGLNHAELQLRQGNWAEIADASGIECVGIVKSCPGGEFAPGTKVAAGLLGRTINGSYAEYTRAAVTNVIAKETPWPPSSIELPIWTDSRSSIERPARLATRSCCCCTGFRAPAICSET